MLHPMIARALKLTMRSSGLTRVEKGYLHEFTWCMKQAVEYLDDAIDVEYCPMLHAVTIDEQLSAAIMYECKAVEYLSDLETTMVSVDGSLYIPF
jgi:hypothetical protein